MTQPAANGEWQRVHPLSPLLSGGVVLLAILGWLISQQFERIFGAFGRPEQPDDWEGSGYDAVLSNPLLSLAGLILVIGGVIGVNAAIWWATRYRIGPTSTELRTGLLFRQHRQVRHDRVQAVDVSQPILARLFGLAQVRVESAGGSDSHLALTYLPLREAERTRDQLLGLAAAADAPGVTGGEGGKSDASQRNPTSTVLLLQMPFERLIMSMVLAAAPAAGVFAALAIIVLVLTSSVGVGIGLFLGSIPPLVLVLLGRIRGLLTWANLTVHESGDTLRIRRGLTSVRTSTVPIRRVQAVEATQRLMWRQKDWWDLKINVAGASLGGDATETESVLVPVGTLEELRRIVGVLLPSADPEVVADALRAPHQLGGDWVVAPRSARWVAPFAWRRTGAHVGPDAVVTRGGWLRRRVQVVPQGRVQSIALRQGPIDRRLGLADLHLVSTVGPVSPVLEHLTVTDATALAQIESTLTAAARRVPLPAPTAPSEEPDTPSTACDAGPNPLD